MSLPHYQANPRTQTCELLILLTAIDQHLNITFRLLPPGGQTYGPTTSWPCQIRALEETPLIRMSTQLQTAPRLPCLL